MNKIFYILIILFFSINKNIISQDLIHEYGVFKFYDLNKDKTWDEIYIHDSSQKQILSKYIPFDENPYLKLEIPKIIPKPNKPIADCLKSDYYQPLNKIKFDLKALSTKEKRDIANTYFGLEKADSTNFILLNTKSASDNFRYDSPRYLCIRHSFTAIGKGKSFEKFIFDVIDEKGKIYRTPEFEKKDEIVDYVILEGKDRLFLAIENKGIEIYDIEEEKTILTDTSLINQINYIELMNDDIIIVYPYIDNDTPKWYVFDEVMKFALRTKVFNFYIKEPSNEKYIKVFDLKKRIVYQKLVDSAISKINIEENKIQINDIDVNYKKSFKKYKY